MRFKVKVSPSILEVEEGLILLPLESKVESRTLSPLLWASYWRDVVLSNCVLSILILRLFIERNTSILFKI